MSGAATQAVIAGARSAVPNFWPGSKRFHELPQCVSSIFADTSVTDGGPPNYHLTSMTDEEASWGQKSWFGFEALKRSAPPPALSLTRSGQPGVDPGFNNASRFFTSTAAFDAKIGGGNGFITYCVRCTTCPYYGFYATSGGGTNTPLHHYIAITSTQVQWTYGQETAFTTISLNHGVSTGVFRNWIVQCDGASTGHVMTVWQNNVSVGSQSGINRGFGVNAGTARSVLGGLTGGYEVLAAGAFDGTLSAGDRASFES